MTASDVQLVMRDIRAGHKVGNHGETVGEGCAGCTGDVEAINQCDRRGGIVWRSYRCA